jgi:hypothetical protein
MTEQKKTTPKGGRRGGTVFPRVDLAKAVKYAGKLVSKTHTGAQPKEIVYPGVFGTSGGQGNVRVSALRQFGLLKGNGSAFEATQLAKDIVAAPKEEKPALLAQSFLKSKLCKKVYDTFQSDTVGKGKIRQQVLNFKVHPESADECVEVVLASLVTAGLGSVSDDQVTFMHVGELVKAEEKPDSTDVDASEPNEDDREGATDGNDEIAAPNTPEDVLARTPTLQPEISTQQRRQSSTQVSIAIDPSMDPEKLEKLLKVLRDFGQI